MSLSLVFTAYNRPQYLIETVNSWNNTRNLRMWNATFFIEPSDQQQVVSDIAMALSTEVTTRINETVQGVLVNPWNALNTAFEGGADFVVLAEDDVVVSQDTLEYFEWASVEYQTSYNTLCLDAFSDNGTGNDNQVQASTAFSPLVWGTWRDRWENTLRDTWDKDYSTGNPDGSEAGWDWNINRIIEDQGLHVIRPVNSRSDHIGLDGGTHTTPETFVESRGAGFNAFRGRQRYRQV